MTQLGVEGEDDGEDTGLEETEDGGERRQFAAAAVFVKTAARPERYVRRIFKKGKARDRSVVVSTLLRNKSKQLQRKREMNNK